ncbi:TIGR02281 family clan AA aspartic protease [Scytonema sp. NUACC26]|uniref:retropepsin-like aspartic protease family protein n=1 Tax=Scytonema sp. NUACC26 TaxID=3140176 RepID=UPI0034DBA498
MLQPILSRAALITVSSTLMVLAVACQQGQQAATKISEGEQYVPTEKKVAAPTATTVEKPTIPQPKPVRQQPSEIELSYFEQGLDKAVGALSISQSAQSSEDWKLVATELREAIVLMKKVPVDSPYFNSAQARVLDYQRQLKYALQRVTRPVTPPVLIPVPPAPDVALAPTIPAAPQNLNKKPPVLVSKKPSLPLSKPNVVVSVRQKQAYSIPIAVPKPKEPPVYTAPIKRRLGGTPIIEVTFNGIQRFEMILDTGASGTVITQKMAIALGVVPVTKAKANTASSKAVEFPVGYVDSVEVAGVKTRQLPVAIAGGELDTGLLGHDFFGNYDITIKRNTVEFRPQLHPHNKSNEEPEVIVPPLPREPQAREPQPIEVPLPN